MIDVDGSMMEGGGQLLRMAITYSAVKGAPVRVRNIRAGRRQPGLRPQHLTTLKAVAEICDADASGLSLGSTEVEFLPGPPRGGDYDLDIGTAGSISLLLQCVAPIAAFASSPVRLSVRGGTAVRWSPPTLMLDRVVWEAVRRMGFRGELAVRREGFYPRGGGLVEATITPLEVLKPFVAGRPEQVRLVRGVSICGRLPEHVARRQARSAEAILREAGYRAEIEHRVAAGREAPLSPGSYICLWAETEPRTFMGADALGERGKPAERVGAEAAESLVGQLRTGAAVDLHTADSLVLLCSLADGESDFTTSKLTMHTRTAMELARIITGAEFEVEGELGEPALIRCRGVGLGNNLQGHRHPE